LTQHVSRKELKTDEVRDTFLQGIKALASHQQATLYIVVAALVVVLGVFGWRAYAARETVKASAAFDNSMNVFQAPVAAPGTTPQPGVVTYKDEKTKYTEAVQKLADVAAKYPTSSLAWALLADDAFERGSVVESYAYARTGYHRGLDSLRRNGWKGHGPVPWEHEPNRGFLRALHGLARAAQAIGEQEEYARCSQFLKDSSPTAAQTLG